MSDIWKREAEAWKEIAEGRQSVIKDLLENSKKTYKRIEELTQELEDIRNLQNRSV